MRRTGGCAPGSPSAGLHDAEVEHLPWSWEDGKCLIACAEGPIPALPSGELHWKPGFHYLATSADLAAYRMNVAIIGPKGVPHP